jgi:elongation factor 3
VAGKAIAPLRQVSEVPEGDASDLTPSKSCRSRPAFTIPFYPLQEGRRRGICFSPAAVYVSQLAANLVNAKNFDVPQWESLAPFPAFVAQTPELVSVTREWVQVRSAAEDLDKGEVPDDERARICATANSPWCTVRRYCSTLLPSASKLAIIMVSAPRTVLESPP